MEELRPCPRCGSTEVSGSVCGGIVSFGCGEFEYEVVCECGITFDTTTFDTAKEAEERGIAEWNTREERTCRIVEDSCGNPSCSECGASYLCMTDAEFCPYCGAKVVS